MSTKKRCAVPSSLGQERAAASGGRNAQAIAGHWLREAGVGDEERRELRARVGWQIRPWVLKGERNEGWIGSVLILPGVWERSDNGKRTLRAVGRMDIDAARPLLPIDASPASSVLLLAGIEIDDEWWTHARSSSAYAQAVCERLQSAETGWEPIAAQWWTPTPRGFQCALAELAGRRHGETPAAIMGRGHPRCAGRFAVRDALARVVAQAPEAAAKALKKGMRRRVLEHAIRRDWTPAWRTWLQSWAGAASLRIVSAWGSERSLGGITRKPVGMALLRLEDGDASVRARRVRCVLNAPLWGRSWVTGSVKAERTLSAGGAEHEVIGALLSEELGHDATPTQVRRALRLGAVQWPQRVRTSSGKALHEWDSTLVEAALAGPDGPRSRAQWRCLDAMVSTLKRLDLGYQGWAEAAAGGYLAMVQRIKRQSVDEIIAEVEEVGRDARNMLRWMQRLVTQEVLRWCAHAGIEGEELTEHDHALSLAVHNRLIATVRVGMDYAKARRLAHRSEGIAHRAALAVRRLMIEEGGENRWESPAVAGMRGLQSLREVALESRALEHCAGDARTTNLMSTGRRLWHAYQVPAGGQWPRCTITVFESHNGEVRASELDGGRKVKDINNEKALRNAMRAPIEAGFARARAQGRTFDNATEERATAIARNGALMSAAEQLRNDLLWRGVGKILAGIRRTSVEGWTAAAIEAERNTVEATR